MSDGWGTERDGYDAVEWLAESAFTDGNIGTIGFSALGITQQMMAPAAPPSLKCQYIGVAAGSIYHHAAYPGGQLLKDQIEGWLGYYAKDPSVISFLRSQPHYNEFWSRFDAVSMAHKVTAPAIHYGGWYDTFIQGSLDSFVARQVNGSEGARGKQKLIIGPWTHHWPDTMKLGDFEVPKNAQEMPAAFSPKRWFDHYLKKIENKVEDLPAVTYYVMGPLDGTPSSGNVWRTADHWPIPSKRTAFYLEADRGLRMERPNEDDAVFSYMYDPDEPIPTIGGRNLFIESGPKDQREIEKRDDVLLFTSDPLQEDLEITGHILATLFFSSESSDTDVVMRFCDVYPDGKSVLIADSIFRTGLLHHGPHEVVEHMPGEAVEVALDLWSTSIVIAKGHRLRVSVSSSNFPRFERNLNHGARGFESAGVEDAVAVKNALHVGKRFPSRIELPIVSN